MSNLELADQGILAALGLKLVNVLAGAVTSFVALRFFDGLTLFERWTTFVGGWAIAAWGASPITAYFNLAERIEVGFALLFGLFGMAAAAAIIKAIKENALVDLILRRGRATPGEKL